MFAQFSLPQQHRRMTYQNKKAKPRDSNGRPHWSLWVRVGLHDQREQPTDRDSVLCVLGFTTNTVSNKTDRTRLHNPPQWATNNHTPKQVWSKATSKGRNIPPTCEQHRNTTQLQAWSPRHTARNQSNNITHHLDKRSTMGNTSTRHLDIQQSRILGETPQSQAQSNIHARSTMSSSNGQAWGLQKNNSPQTRRHNRRLCRETSQLEHSQQKRMLSTAWKGETCFKVKKNARPPKPPTATPTTPNKALPAPSQQQQEQAQQKRRCTQKKPERPEEMATSNEKHPSSEQQPHPATSIPRPKELPTTEDYWIREGHLWKRVRIKPRTALYIPQQTQDGPDVTKLIPERTTIVKPTSGARWHRIDDDWTTKREATLNVPWTGSTNSEESTSFIQRWGTWRGWKGSTTSKASKRTHSTSTANTTGKSRAWTHTSTFQKLVSNMRSQQG